jgi:diaminobutyrate-2-oxoglutarate transaminase
VPDIVCLAKSIGGLGLPMAIVLISEALDKWNPGEDSGTFCGNNLAFVAATAALKKYWSESGFSSHFELTGDVLRGRLELIGSKALDHIRDIRGVGMMFGLEFYDEEIAGEIVADCFLNGLIVAACGSRDEVIKIIPALNISAGELAEGLDVLEMSVQRVVQKQRMKSRSKVQAIYC